MHSNKGRLWRRNAAGYIVAPRRGKTPFLGFGEGGRGEGKEGEGGGEGM
jgi:hypothetical protein